MLLRAERPGQSLRGSSTLLSGKIATTLGALLVALNKPGNRLRAQDLSSEDLGLSPCSLLSELGFLQTSVPHLCTEDGNRASSYSYCERISQCLQSFVAHGHRGAQAEGGGGKDADRWMSFSRWDLKESEGDVNHQKW